MKRLIKLIIVCFILAGVWNLYGDHLKNGNYQAAYLDAKTDIIAIKENPTVISTYERLQTGFSTLIDKLDQKMDPESNFKSKSVEKPDLTSPTTQSFSVYNIEIGDSKEKVEKQVGKAKRSSINEYGVNWHAYHTDYQNFFMAAYNDAGKVAGLYTNQDLITSKSGITLNSSKDKALKLLGEPLTSMRKGIVTYQMQDTQESTLFKLDDNYITIFYDKHENDRVTAIQIISADLEKQKKTFYPEPNDELKEGFEYQLFDLTNAARVTHGLNFLTWNEVVKDTARKHSADMAKNNYFNHTNLRGESPFDRMKADNIRFSTAGENLATGQLSSIFAHEGLMNSLGHRENILQKDFRELGVGVDFSSDKRPYYTENFVTK